MDEKHRGVAPKWPATGLDKLDDLVQGIRPKKVTVIAGLPGSGKTTLALQIAQHNAVKERKPWLVFSIEMPGEELGLRAIASLGGVSLQKLDNPSKMAEDDWARMGAAVAQALEAPLFVCDEATTCKAARDNLAGLAQEQGKALGDLTLAANERQARAEVAVKEAGQLALADYAAANRLQQERTGGDQCTAATSIIDKELGL